MLIMGAMIIILVNLNVMNKKVIYTCITGNYEPLIELPYKEEGFDYICFTDNKEMTSETWEIRQIELDKSFETPRRLQRYVKINTHKFLPEYDISIWVDGNIPIIGNLGEMIEKYHETYLTTFHHPYRYCIYDEGTACAIAKKDNPMVILKHMLKYTKEKYPKKNGLVETKMIIRNHNEKDCVDLMESWSTELDNGSLRDQLSFNYVLWKQNKVVNLIDEKIIDGKYIKIVCGHNKSK